MRQPTTNLAGIVRAGRGASKRSSEFDRLQEQTSPDHFGLARVNKAARAVKQEAEMRANFANTMGEMKRDHAEDLLKIADDTNKVIGQANRTMRKAGLVAAAGGYGAKAIALSKQKDPEAPLTIDYSEWEQSITEREGKYNDPNYGKGPDNTSDFPSFEDWQQQQKPGETTATQQVPGAPVAAPNNQQTSDTLAPGGGRNWQALSTVIRSVEGTLGDKGFNTRFGGAQFTPGKDHPRLGAPTPWGTTSAAAGAFQIMPKTWDTVVQPNLNLPDFSPSSQLQAGRFLVQNRDVNPDADLTDFNTFSSAISKLSPEWAGLPNTASGRTGFHGQANTTMRDAHRLYLQTLGATQ